MQQDGNENPFKLLGDDVLQHFFSTLNPSELARLSMVCRRFEIHAQNITLNLSLENQRRTRLQRFNVTDRHYHLADSIIDGLFNGKTFDVVLLGPPDIQQTLLRYIRDTRDRTATPKIDFLFPAEGSYEKDFKKIPFIARKVYPHHLMNYPGKLRIHNTNLNTKIEMIGAHKEIIQSTQLILIAGGDCRYYHEKIKNMTGKWPAENNDQIVFNFSPPSQPIEQSKSADELSLLHTQLVNQWARGIFDSLIGQLRKKVNRYQKVDLILNSSGRSFRLVILDSNNARLVTPKDYIHPVLKKAMDCSILTLLQSIKDIPNYQTYVTLKHINNFDYPRHKQGHMTHLGPTNWHIDNIDDMIAFVEQRINDTKSTCVCM